MSLTILSVAYPFAPVTPDSAGGAEQVLSLLDRALVRAGHRSVVVSCEGSKVEGRLEAFPQRAGWIEDNRPAVYDMVRKTIGRALNEWKPDVIHFHGLDFPAYLPAPGLPALVTLHLPPAWYPPAALQPERPGTWLVCVSQSQLRSCPVDSYMLPPIENGVPVDSFGARIRKRDFALVLGRICPEKGVHLAMAAAAEAGVPLVIAGKVYPYREHEAYFRRDILPGLDGRRVRFIGPVALARKRRMLAAARCVLAPSMAPETSSLVAMESFASGTPVIAFPAGALPEIVEHGRTGFLVSSVREMAEAIRRAKSIDPDACRRAAVERFSADRMTGEYLALYNQLSAGAVNATRPSSLAGVGR